MDKVYMIVRYQDYEGIEIQEPLYESLEDAYSEIERIMKEEEGWEKLNETQWDKECSNLEIMILDIVTTKTKKA